MNDQVPLSGSFEERVVLGKPITYSAEAAKAATRIVDKILASVQPTECSACGQKPAKP